jgi:branched-subunit amino acid ABC-type transport system permease component
MYFGGRGKVKFWIIAVNGTLVFQTACMLAWSWTLVRLYKDIEHSEKLLPNKRIFILHGSLLVAYILIFVIQLILYYLYNRTLYGSDENLTLLGVIDISVCLQDLIQMLTFFLVVKLMIPLTKSEKEKRSKFQQFIFKGFADIKEL